MHYSSSLWWCRGLGLVGTKASETWQNEYDKREKELEKFLTIADQYGVCKPGCFIMVVLL